MLSAMRTGAKSALMKIFLFGLLLMAMTGLAVMDVQGMFRKGVSDTSVAHIGNAKITAPEFQRMVQSSLRRQNLPMPIALQLGLPRQVLDQEISSRVFALAANDMGLTPDDATAAKAVRDMITPLMQQGKMTDKQALEALLTNAGLSEQGLVSLIKMDTATKNLLQILSAGARAPRQLAEDAAKYKYETRKGTYFTLTAADLDKPQEPSEEELKAHYEEISNAFALPEYRSFSVLVLDKTGAGAVTVSDEDAKKQYDDHKDDYTTPASRVVSQVVAKDEATAKKIYDAAKSGDLKKAAEAQKAAFVAARAYGEKEMPEELSPTVFGAKEPGLLPPVQSPLGWHVLKVEKISPQAVKTFDEVKAAIQKDLSESKSADALYDKANQIDDAIAGGASLQDTADKFGLKLQSFAKLDATGADIDNKKPASTLPAADKVLAQVFRLSKGEAGQLIEAPSGEFLVAQVDDITPSQKQPYEKVRDKVLASWKQKKQVDTLDAQAAKITESLKLGDSFDKLAAKYGKTPSVTDWLQRGADPAKVKSTRTVISSLFSLAKPGDASAMADNDSVTVLRLDERRAGGTADKDKEAAAALEATLNRALQNDILDQYRMHLMARYDVTINDKLLETLFKPQDDENAE